MLQETVLSLLCIAAFLILLLDAMLHLKLGGFVAAVKILEEKIRQGK